MKKKQKIIISLVIVLFIIATIIVICYLNKSNNNSDNEVDFINSYREIDKNQVAYQDDVTIDELKNDIGATGNTEIYEIQQEYDGRNVLAVKPDITYKVAFAGMVINSQPTMEELDDIFNKNAPAENGIWIEEESRDKVLEFFNGDSTESDYAIDNEGYLKVQNKNNQNDIDKKVENIINGEKQYILDISSVCYIVDNLTGEIWDYNFENMDKYQTYEYFEDNDKMIIFITENTNNLLSNSDIFNSIIELM